MRREQVERCLATTMTVKDWCRLNKVPESTMYAWMARFRKEDPGMFDDLRAGEWIELSRGAIAGRTAIERAPAAPSGTAPADPGGPRGAIVVRVNGADVAVPPGADEHDVAAVLRAVASL